MPCANCACQNTSGGCDKVSSIPLPKAGTTPSAQAKLWSTSNYGSTSTASNAAHENTPLLDGAQQPLAKCEKHNGIRGVCCRDLKQDNQRHLVNPDVVRDVIIGLSDGLTVPFALTAGLSGVGSTRIVVLAGFAELVSGAISMGVGGLLSAQAELSHYNYMCQATAERVHQSCAGELEREVCDILAPFGVPNDIGSQIASKLQNVERQEQAYEGTSHSLPSPATADRSAHIRPDGLVGPSRGLTPFLVRIGEGLEKVEASRVWQSALIIGTSYFVGGFIPLLPYIIFSSVKQALLCSIAITGVVLLVFGVVKQSATGAANDTRGLLWGAFSTLFVGAAAAGSSFAIVRALEGSS